MRNKRGWMRLLEAVIAVLIMASVLIVLYVSGPKAQSYSDYVSGLEVSLLEKIATNESLVAAVLDSNEVVLNYYVNSSVPLNFNSMAIVCPLSGESCVREVISENEIFVKGRMISANLTKYDPKLVRIYIWEK